jgi:hypothetical protein
MIKTFGKITLATILAALVVGVPMGAKAQPATPASTNAPAADAKPKITRFRGKLGEIDKVNKTITFDDKAKRVFEVTSETKIIRGGQPATLDDAMVGDAVSGSYIKTDDGKKVAKFLRFGPKPTTAAAPAPTK